MIPAVNDYANFVTESYKNFLSELRDALGKDEDVQWTFNVLFLKKIKDVWYEFEYKHPACSNFNQALPEDDVELYKTMRQQFKNLPEEYRNEEIRYFLNSKFNSPGIKEALITFRESANKKPDPFLLIKEDIETCFKKIIKHSNEVIKDILKNSSDEMVKDMMENKPDEVRILKKEIAVVRYSKDDPSVISGRLSLNKNYSQECASCKAWRTTAHKLSTCSKCREVAYCNSDCQKRDWKEHKLVCVKK